MRTLHKPINIEFLSVGELNKNVQKNKLVCVSDRERI